MTRMVHEYVSARLQASVGHVQDAVRQVWKFVLVPSYIPVSWNIFKGKTMELATSLQ